MRRLVTLFTFLLAVLLALASPASAAVIWTCTHTADTVSGQAYVSYGACTANGGTYTVSGDGLGAAGGAPASTAVGLSDASRAFCGSTQKVLKQLILHSEAAAANLAIIAWDPVAFRVLAYTSNGASPNFPLQSTAQVLPAGTFFSFVAVCQ